MVENELFCYTCSIGFSSVVNLKEHNLSLMHHKVYDHQMKNNGQKRPQHECFICNKVMIIDFWEGHINSKRHKQQLEQMRSVLMSNKSWIPPPPAPPGPRGGHQSRLRGPSPCNSRDSSASSHHSQPASSPVFSVQSWSMPMRPLPFRPQMPGPGPGPWSMPGYQQWGPRPPYRPFMGPRHLPPSNGSSRSSPIDRNRPENYDDSNERRSNASRENREAGGVTKTGTAGPQTDLGETCGSLDKEKKDKSVRERLRLMSGSDVERGGDKDEVDALLKRAQAMQDTFRKQRDEVKSREEAEKKEEQRKPMKDVEAKLKAANESSMKKVKGLIERSSVISPVRMASDDSSRVHPSPLGTKPSSEAKAAAGKDRQTLMNLISMPRSRRERRQVEDIIRKATQKRLSRPRLQPQTSSSTDAETDANQETDTLSSTIMDVIMRHEKGESEALPTIDLNLEEMTSGVTSLTTTARPEEVQTARSEASSVAPAAKKRRTCGSPPPAPETVEIGTAMEMTQSEEVTRMQMALELSVQEDGMRKKIKEVDAQIEEQRVILDAVRRRIEELEGKKAKIRLEERALHDRRMDILKESYSKVVEASNPSVSSFTEQPETPVADSSVAPSVSSSLVTVKKEAVETTSCSMGEEEEVVVDEGDVEEEVDDEDEEEEESAPLIGNMTAREIRERAMAIIEGGAMSFGDLDDVLNELMRVSNNQEDSTQDEETLEEAPSRRASQKRRRKKSEEMTTPDTSACDETPMPEAESVVSDVLSTQTSPRKAGKQRNSRSSLSPVSSTDDQGSVASSVATTPPIPAFPGSIEAHKGVVHDVHIFRSEVFTCGGDGRVRRFSPQSHECLMEYSGYRKAVRCLCVTEKPKGKPRVFSGGVENLMIVHDLKTGEEMQRLSMDAEIHCMHIFWFSLYLGLSNGVIVTYDLRKNRVIVSRKVSAAEIRSLYATRERSRRVLLVATADGNISVRDVNSGNHMHAVGQVEKAPDTLRTRVLHHTVYTIAEEGKLREFSIMGNTVKKPRKMSSKVTSLFVESGMDILVLGLQDGSVRILYNPEDKSSRMKVYYTAKRSTITSLTCRAHAKTSGLSPLQVLREILAGNKDGSIFVIQFSNDTMECKFGGCSFNFEFEDDIIYHVTRDHVLSSNERDVRCLWNNSCKHRFSKLDCESIENHIRSHV